MENTLHPRSGGSSNYICKKVLYLRDGYNDESSNSFYFNFLFYIYFGGVPLEE